MDDVGTSALELLGTPQNLPTETVPTLLINDLVARNESVVLILDDYHEIQAPAIHGSLQYLLEHLPDNLFVVVSTRIDPPWHLARFRARNQLIEIRAQDLRFNDVARFMMAYLDRGTLDGNRMLTPESISMLTDTPPIDGHGLGWSVGESNGIRYLEHAGGGPGFATIMRVYLERGTGFAILANGTDLDRGGLMDLLAQMEW